ncbi:MAG: hypothetical protein COT74_14090 [Bdellovibrionales bacterium CG10_big_fil_rev_8_21_14_0_10_45_34]|nr:MAG: hypothetical protein COT74_14090 [Bdellovibrionales bacterium CG10_big_fil_rev_8_21_14_0_10_45_34]
MKQSKKPDYVKLRECCFKLKSLEHLLENQQDDQLMELDELDLWYGLGLIMKEIRKDVMQVAREIEDHEIREAKKRV